MKIQEGTPRWPEIAALSPEAYEQFRRTVAANLQPLLDAEGNVRSPSTAWLARAVK